LRPLDMIHLAGSNSTAPRLNSVPVPKCFVGPRSGAAILGRVSSVPSCCGRPQDTRGSATGSAVALDRVLNA
jgi:hypothetical protein